MMNPKFPNVKPATTSREKLLDKVVIAMWIAAMVMLLYYYPQLPEEVPKHFNSAGEPDAWGSKSHLWILPVIGLLVSTLMFYFCKIPHQYNYIKKITAENASFEYQKAREMMRWVNAAITLIFSVLIIETCLVALKKITGLGIWFLPFVIIISMLPLVFYLARPKSK